MFSAPYTPVLLRLTRPRLCQKCCALSSNVPKSTFITPWQRSGGEEGAPTRSREGSVHAV